MFPRSSAAASANSQSTGWFDAWVGWTIKSISSCAPSRAARLREQRPLSKRAEKSLPRRRRGRHAVRVDFGKQIFAVPQGVNLGPNPVAVDDGGLPQRLEDHLVADLADQHRPAAPGYDFLQIRKSATGRPTFVFRQRE